MKNCFGWFNGPCGTNIVSMPIPRSMINGVCSVEMFLSMTALIINILSTWNYIEPMTRYDQS